MDWSVVWNIANILGLLMSCYAAWTARSAEKSSTEARALVVVKKNEQEDGDRFKELIKTLNDAKDAAIRRQQGAQEFVSVGHDITKDKHSIVIAHDCLMTRLPFRLSDPFRENADSAARQLYIAIETITAENVLRDGWKDALTTLQVLIPQCEREERGIRDRDLLRNVTT